MFWTVTELRTCDASEPAEAAEGRFVLHRHHDDWGPHLDLRIEHDGYLAGWRLDAGALAAGVWATEKAPHPPHWLDQHGDATPVDTGTYRWVARDAHRATLHLQGHAAAQEVTLQRTAGLPPACVAEVRAALDAAGAPPDAAANLLRDGTTARARAISRFCGLGRELDGDAFDEGVWRATLAHCTLDAIHAHLRTLEVRFDQKYPPQPVSQPAPLPEAEATADGARVLDLART